MAGAVCRGHVLGKSSVVPVKIGMLCFSWENMMTPLKADWGRVCAGLWGLRSDNCGHGFVNTFIQCFALL